MGWFSKDSKTIKVEKKEGYVIISLNRPKKFNRINLQMISELNSAIKELQQEEVRSVIMTSLGRDFSIGMDIEEVEKHLSDPKDYFNQFFDHLFSLVLSIREMNAPFIAVVRGRVEGLGFSLSLCCDFILAEISTTFSSPNVNLGVIPIGGLHYFLNRLMGPQKSREIIFTGKVIGSNQAVEMGIVSGIIDEAQLITEAKNLAMYFANQPTQALGASKKLIDGANLPKLHEYLEIEKKICMNLIMSDDFKEGIHSLISEDTKSGFMAD
ncbi:MAG: enoyl-CoA hydratase/isomerase family protein [Deltaproteobacteria bacterium]|nr:enoyl-CoA hydratase/isomerase family protein [Deltaproteobacteria bacterium]